MFGLKVVKKKEYLDMQEQRDLYQRDAADKAVQVVNLENEIHYLNSRIADLEQQVQNLRPEHTDESKPVLFEDVAEKPLEVEKPTRKPRKVVKTTEGAKPRKRVVRKSEETE